MVCSGKVRSRIYEQDFLPCSFGGRPKLSAHHALGTLTEVISGGLISWVLEADLKNFFGSLNHDWVLRFVEHRVRRSAPDQLDPALVESGRLRWSGSSERAGNPARRIDQRAVEQRVGDLVDDADLCATGEQLPKMLGVCRSCMSIAAETLQELGLICCPRGLIRLTDIEGFAGTPASATASSRRSTKLTLRLYCLPLLLAAGTLWQIRPVNRGVESDVLVMHDGVRRTESQENNSFYVRN